MGGGAEDLLPCGQRVSDGVQSYREQLERLPLDQRRQLCTKNNLAVPMGWEWPSEWPSGTGYAPAPSKTAGKSSAMVLPPPARFRCEGRSGSVGMGPQ